MKKRTYEKRTGKFLGGEREVPRMSEEMIAEYVGKINPDRMKKLEAKDCSDDK